MTETNTIPQTLKGVETDLIRLIQATTHHEFVDHLVKALAEVRKAHACLED